MLLRVSTAIVVGLIGVGGHAALADAPAQNQMVVAGVPEAVVGFEVSGAGVMARNTVAVDVRRERIGDTTLVTIVPRD
jgi:hypothetical protein